MGRKSSAVAIFHSKIQESNLEANLTDIYGFQNKSELTLLRTNSFSSTSIIVLKVYEHMYTCIIRRFATHRKVCCYALHE